MFKLKKNGEPNSECYCRYPELIENYAEAIADDTQFWDCHHRKEEFYSYAELIARGEYFDVPPEDLIFLTESEHSKMDSMCKRNSETHKGKKPTWRMKRVLCIETGEIFESVREASRKTGINHISSVCLGKKRYKTAGGYHWKFL